MNLLNETKEDIEKSGHSPTDIVFIGSESSGHQCTWEQFCALADAEYDPGYGAPEVATDLIIVFSDGGRLQRGEYDGSEWWEYIGSFRAPMESHPIRNLFGGMWKDLAECNRDGEDA